MRRGRSTGDKTKTQLTRLEVIKDADPSASQYGRHRPGSEGALRFYRAAPVQSSHIACALASMIR